MPTTYTVQQGDCLSSIAKANGFDDWRTIYGDPANADFRILRPNPNVIFAGDQVVIPDKTPTIYQATTGQSYTYSLNTQKTLLRLKFDDAGDLNYSLQVGAVQTSGTVPAGTVLEVTIAADATQGQILTWPTTYDSAAAAGDDAITWNLLIGSLDPPDTISGIQARLKNLGYDPGGVDGIMGPNTEAAIKEFQGDNPPLDVDGICGKHTTSALVDAYGM
jgi:N-acetylmuramoyl-L-alanine amidase